MSRTRHSTEETKSENSGINPKGRIYAFSGFGILRLLAVVLSLIAFICCECTQWCYGEMYCYLPAYASTYVYFSVINLATFIFSSVFYLLHYTGTYIKLPCAYETKIFTELVYLGLDVLLLAFGNVFMISRTGNRSTYIAATVLGCLVMSVTAVHLTLLMIQFRSKLPLSCRSQDGSIENSDFQSGVLDVTSITHPDGALNLTFMRTRTDSPYSERLQPIKESTGNQRIVRSFEAVNITAPSVNGNLSQQENVSLHSDSTFSSGSDTEVKGEWVVS